MIFIHILLGVFLALKLDKWCNNVISIAIIILLIIIEIAFKS
jgi:hypothetical protein